MFLQDQSTTISESKARVVPNVPHCYVFVVCYHDLYEILNSPTSTVATTENNSVKTIHFLRQHNMLQLINVWQHLLFICVASF